MKLICLILFVMTMFLWLLTMLGAFPNFAAHAGWLAWFACLFLGLSIFVNGSLPSLRA